MNLNEQAAVDRFMMSDSLKGLIPEFESVDPHNDRTQVKLTIVTSTLVHQVIGRLISVNRSNRNVVLILQLKNDDQINILNDAGIIGECDIDFTAGQYFQFSGRTNVTNVGLEMNIDGPKISVTIDGTSTVSG